MYGGDVIIVTGYYSYGIGYVIPDTEARVIIILCDIDRMQSPGIDGVAVKFREIYVYFRVFYWIGMLNVEL